MNVCKATECWALFEVEDGCVHEVPLHDTRRHIMSVGCWCLPYLDPQERSVVHHEPQRQADERS